MSEHSDNSSLKASILLLAVTIGALLLANSSLAGAYKELLSLEMGWDIGPFDLTHPSKDWIKNALMAVFFLSVGLEIKAEFQEGALADRSRALLPFIGAAGGMIMPAIVFFLIAGDMPSLTRGWAVPTATDIAFAVAVVGLLGSRVPASARLLLLAVAVIDDLGAILVIGVFYTSAFQLWAIAGMGVAILALAALNQRKVYALIPYLVVGALLWLFTLQSGINATLSGVILALFIPLRGDGDSPLHKLSNALKTPVNFAIMPIFAFANAGVSLAGLGLADLAKPLTLAIALGLILGKPIGISLAILAATKLRIAQLPLGMGWSGMIGITCLAGIGFTMSLFIGGLAFESEVLINQMRLGVLVGSLTAALLGSLLIILFCPVASPDREG